MADTIYPVDAVAGSPSYGGRMLRQVNAVAFGGATASRPLGGRSGVRPGTSTTTVSATSTTWSCGPLSGVADVQTAAESGMVSFALDAVATGAITAASASFARQDLIYIQIDIPVEDGSAVPVVTRKYVAGTVASTDPALPVSRAFAIARINVPISGGGAPTVTWIAPYAVAAGGVIPVLNAVQRNAVSTAAGSATQPVYRMDSGWFEQYMAAGTVATPGWYDTAVRNFYKRGTDVNPIPVAVADVPGSSLTFGLESPRFCTFTFAGGLQVNQSLTASIYLNVDGVDVQVTTWARQESGGTPYLRVAETYGALLAAGTHTVKLRVIATVAGASVAQAPGWSMVGTVPILGTYN